MARNETLPEKKKIPGLSYAVLADGIELPVLDITHPLFISSIDEEKLSRILKDVEKKGEKRAEGFQNLPAFVKGFLAKRSYVMADFLSEPCEDAFLSGIATLMMKLGPGLIGGGRKMFLDRLAAKGLGAIALRMRVRDISRCQADALIPRLEESPGKNLCIVNIAGGTACDSLNALILVQKEDRSLLKYREIEINVLDIDPTGPAFAGRCLKSLQAPGSDFHGLHISLRSMPYDWNDPAALEPLLSERKDWLQICASEGGLFEYGSDEAMARTLEALYDHSEAEMKIVGSLMRDIGTIDPGARAALRITNIKARLLGLGGLKSVLAGSRWKIDGVQENNPRYVVFSLSKGSAG